MKTYDEIHDDIIANPNKYSLETIERLYFDKNNLLTQSDLIDLLAIYIITCSTKQIIPVSGYLAGAGAKGDKQCRGGDM